MPGGIPGGGQMMRSMSQDRSIGRQRLKAGTARRVLGYARGHGGAIAAFLALTLVSAALVAVTPLLLREIIDRGVTPGDRRVVITFAALAAGLAVVDLGVTWASRWISARIGEGLIFDLRTEVFGHVLRQPVAFFTRAQTGALVSRLNTDVVGAQQAFTSTLSSVVGNTVQLVVIVVAMASMSPVLTLAALALLPLFLVPARIAGDRLSGLAREQMRGNAEMGSRMTERFNVAGALLVKLFGRPAQEDAEFAQRAGRVRDLGVRIAVIRTVFFAGLGFVAALATALVYGFGGLMAISGGLTVGSLVALTALLGRLYQPLTALANVRVDVMTALVSFERVFEVLDLQPLVREREGAVDLPEGALGVELDHVSFAYPSAAQVSLDSLETTTAGDRGDGEPVLHDITASIAPGELVALVGPSGAGKTTLTGLVARLHDPTAGAVRIGGVDLRDATLGSVADRVGMVTQEAHMFHDTIRANLLYARPDATEAQMEQALRDAQVWSLVERLPSGLDTVVGDRGHRLSGGEKQRLAIARLLLKSPEVVVLDEATAHLDSENEAAVHAALDRALEGRTALVIAHRLSTIRSADRILVLRGGRLVEQGRHEDLLAAGGLYSLLHATQFAE